MARYLTVLAGALLGLATPASAQQFSFDTENAFRLPRQMNTADQALFNYGRGFFDHVWNVVPRQGGSAALGPLFSAQSCSSCHIHDGRGVPPEAGEPLESMVLFLGAGADVVDGLTVPRPDPVYGAQIQDRAIDGVMPEASVSVQWQAAGVAGADLRRPLFVVSDLSHGPLADPAGLVPRLAPQLIGLGWLAEIPAGDILAAADPDDRDGDGISGRANWALSPETGQLELGRFGWKASIPSVRAQVDRAAHDDIGLSTPFSSGAAGDCTAAQVDCLEAATTLGEDGFDLDDGLARLLAFYTKNLAVPPRRDGDASMVAAGEQLFGETGCAACHQPQQVTASGQTVMPYTDLLLHDMGDGLADGFEIGVATGREWRTPPLWGIGLTEQVSGATNFLHDGRARDLREAILWHGGEAESARRNFRALSPGAQNSLLSFLASL